MPRHTAASTRVRRGVVAASGVLLALGAVHLPASADDETRQPPVAAKEESSNGPRWEVGPVLVHRLRNSVSTSQDAARRVDVLAERSAVLAARADRTAARAEQLYAAAMSGESPGALERFVDWVLGAESPVDVAIAAAEADRRMQQRVEAVGAALMDARRDAVAAEVAQSRALADMAAEERRIAADVAARSAIAQVRFAPAYQPPDRAQDRRNRSAVHAWKEYLSSLADAGVVPPPAAQLRDAGDLPKPLRPLVDKAGRVSPGVAEVRRRGRRPIPVLARETVGAVSAAFNMIGQPTPVEKADAYACGGLTEQAWGMAAHSLPLSSTAQWNRLRSVPRRHAQPGDLVYLGDEVLGVHRAGVYVGGKHVILADPRDGEVAVQPIPSGEVYGIKRPTLPTQERRSTAPVPDGVVTGCGEIDVPEVPAPVALTPPVSTLIDSVPPAPLADLSTPGPGAAFPLLSRVAGTWQVPGVAGQAPTWAFPMPSGSYVRSSGFGQLGSLWSSGRHTGQDLTAPVGTPVRAARGGVVTVESPAWAGNLVRIDHGGGFESWYAHLSKVFVRSGQTVTQGQPLGAVGSEGNSTGPHLHFEIRNDGIPMDPMTLLP